MSPLLLIAPSPSRPVAPSLYIPTPLLLIRRGGAQPFERLFDLWFDVFVLLGLEQNLQRPDRAPVTERAERDDHRHSDAVAGGAAEKREQRLDRAFVSQVA